MRQQKPQWAKLTSGLFVPPYLKFAPGYPCCCDGNTNVCPYFQDTFDSSPIGSEWTEEIGSWSISSGELVVAVSSGPLISNSVTNPNPGDDNELNIHVDASVSVFGSAVRLIFEYVDTDNYWFLEATFNTPASTSTLGIYQRDASVETLKSSLQTRTLVTSATLHVCVSHEGIIAGVGDTSSSADGPFFAGDILSTSKTALGAVGVSGNAEFDNFELSRLRENQAVPCVLCQACAFCTETVPPAELAVTFAGVENGSCGDCEGVGGVNGTFILSAYGTDPDTGLGLLSGSNRCTWSLETDVACTYIGVRATVAASGGGRVMSVIIWKGTWGNASAAAEFKDKFASGACDWVDLDLPANGPFFVDCDFAPGGVDATCKVTAL